MQILRMGRVIVALTAAFVLVSTEPLEASRFTGVTITGASNADDGYQSDHLKEDRLEPILFSMFGIPINPQAGLNGRYSDGLAISERFYLDLGFTFADTENYAIGAAQSGPGFFWSGNVFPVFALGPRRNWNDPDGQITRLLGNNGGVLDPSRLYYVNIGANDFGGLLHSLPDEAVTRANLIDGYTRLIDAGARSFLVLNQYTFGLSPMPLNDLLPGIVEELRATYGIEIIYADMDSLSIALGDNPGGFGFNPATSHIACFSGGIVVCTPEEASERINWDNTHLTAAANAVFGRALARLVAGPESLSTSLLPSFAQMGAWQSHLGSRLDRIRLSERRRTYVQVASLSSDRSLYDLDAREGDAGVFVRVSAAEFRRSAGNADPLVKSDGFAATLGMDGDVTSAVRVGGALSYGETSSVVATRDGMDLRSYAASFYGLWMGGEQESLLRPMIEGSATVAMLDARTRRDVGLPGIAASGNSKGWHYAANVKAGIDIVLMPVVLSPVIGIVWQEVDLDGYSESGAPPGFNLIVDNQQQGSLVSEIGGRLTGYWGSLQTGVEMHWLHEFQSSIRRISVAPDNFPGLPFTAVTGEADRNYGRLGLSLRGQIEGLGAVEVEYRRTLFRDDWREHGLSVQLRIPLN